MKAVISILIILGLYLMGKSIFTNYDNVNKRQRGGTAETARPSSALAGLPDRFEPALDAAAKQGPASLKAFIEKYRTYIHDPRLGDIELDYVVLVSRSNPAEAKRVFGEVKARTPASSPLQPRLQRLAKTYE